MTVNVARTEEEAERQRIKEEEELKQHRLAMAKREGKIQAKKNAANLRSSKGFLTQKEDDSESMRASFCNVKTWQKCNRRQTSNWAGLCNLH